MTATTPMRAPGGATVDVVPDKQGTPHIHISLFEGGLRSTFWRLTAEQAQELRRALNAATLP